jgi:drug/metabolite transporter (DMT)-like permease
LSVEIDEAARAKFLLVLLSIGWGTTWPIMKLALLEIPPLSMRMGTAAIGAMVVVTIVKLGGRSMYVPRKAWAHVFATGVLNIVGFGLFSSFAQISTTTSRVAIMTYTMPIWSCLLARFVLGERMTLNRQIALVLCVSGLAVLVYPLAEHGIPIGLLLATCAGFSWAAGTIYLKWARIEADPIGVAAWQLVVAVFVIALCVFTFEGSVHLWPVSGWALFGVLFTGTIGSGIAYLIWFEIIRVLPAMTASLGILSSPVIGVLTSMLILGERLTLSDTIGFALIFAASACVLVRRQAA